MLCWIQIMNWEISIFLCIVNNLVKVCFENDRSNSTVDMFAMVLMSMLITLSIWSMTFQILVVYT